MKRLSFFILCLCLLTACAPRSTTPLEEESAPSIEESSSASSALEAKALTPEEVSSSSSEASSEEEPEYPAPTLTDTEKQMLQSNLDLFVYFIGASEVDSPAALSPKVVLSACIAEIERTKDLNAYVFSQNDSGQDFIPANLIAEKAAQLFGLENFSATSDESYDSEQSCYVASAVEIPKVSASDVMGAPDDQVSWKVSIDDNDFLYIGKIFRQNGMPYLRFASVQKIA